MMEFLRGERSGQTQAADTDTVQYNQRMSSNSEKKHVFFGGQYDTVHVDSRGFALVHLIP